MFYCEIPWFYQDLKSENFVFFESVLSSHCENTVPVCRDHFKFSQMRNEAPLQLYRLFLHFGTGTTFLFFGSQIHQCFLKYVSCLQI